MLAAAEQRPQFGALDLAEFDPIARASSFEARTNN
jgi:hypothetical protein